MRFTHFDARHPFRGRNEYYGLLRDGYVFVGFVRQDVSKPSDGRNNGDDESEKAYCRICHE